MEKPPRRIADSTQCHVDEPVRAAGGFAAAGCQCVILLGRWRVRVRHAGSILPVVVGFRAPGKRSGSSVGKVATSNGALWPAVVDVRDQRDVPYVRQPVAHRPDRLLRSAGVREDQHARPRAIAVRDAACRCCVHRASPPWTSHTRRIPLPPLSLPGLIARKALLRCCGFGLSAAIVGWRPGLVDMPVIVRHQDRGALRLDHRRDQALCRRRLGDLIFDHRHNVDIGSACSLVFAGRAWSSR